jgi:hypothetical protein
MFDEKTDDDSVRKLRSRFFEESLKFLILS